MNTDTYKHVKDSYNTGAEQYAEYWKVPHDFIDIDRQYFSKAMPPAAKILDAGCGPGMDSMVSGHLLAFYILTNKTLQVY